ncbi:uncharacterized protein VNE69_04151 [Vairimorpha necatrix]|uniref:Uncharacterized protein n=1 Tax=Vairimorpha necatrix TaxID=6039 RepID=A0AAX4JBK5_9MICR
MESGTKRNEEKEAEDSFNKSNIVYATSMKADVFALDSKIQEKINFMGTDVVLKSAGEDKMGVLKNVRLVFIWLLKRGNEGKFKTIEYDEKYKRSIEAAKTACVDAVLEDKEVSVEEVLKKHEMLAHDYIVGQLRLNSEGNKFILTMIDHWTNMAECVREKSKDMGVIVEPIER